jgi:hypothetical protein
MNHGLISNFPMHPQDSNPERAACSDTTSNTEKQIILANQACRRQIPNISQKPRINSQQSTAATSSGDLNSDVATKVVVANSIDFKDPAVNKTIASVTWTKRDLDKSTRQSSDRKSSCSQYPL